MENKVNILIVEDEQIVAEDLELRLLSLGYQISGKATSSKEALSLLEENKPNLILMDIKLKGTTNGIETAGIVKEKYNIPVVYITAYAEKKNLLQIKETEPFGIIIKPFDDQELINVIETAMHKYGMELQLKESKEHLHTVLNSIFDAVISTDIKSKILSMNSMAEQLTGWSFYQAQGRLLSDVYNIVNMKTGNKCENPVQKVLKYGKTVNLSNQTLLISKDGTKYPIADSGAPILNNNGSITGVVLVFRDVKDEYKMQQELYEHEERLSAIYTMSPIVIIVSTIDEGRFIEVNNAFTQFMGWKAEEVIGKTSLEINLWADPAREQRQRFISEIKNKGVVRNDEFIFQDKNGNLKTGLLSAQVIQIEGKSYLLTNVVNVTERKRAEEQIKKDLEEKEILLKEIHHRVKNNLQVIRSLIHMQLTKDKDPTFHTCATELSNRILSMAMIHEQLYSAENLSEINLQSYIGTLVNRIFQSYSSQNISIKKGIRNLNLSLDQSVPFGLMVTELITNAVKHAFPGDTKGKVTITVESKQNSYELSVRDNGIGIPANINVQNPTTLGLKLVTILADQLEGEVKICRGKGTNIKFIFPVNTN